MTQLEECEHWIFYDIKKLLLIFKDITEIYVLAGYLTWNIWKDICIKLSEKVKLQNHKNGTISLVNLFICCGYI